MVLDVVLALLVVLAGVLYVYFAHPKTPPTPAPVPPPPVPPPPAPVGQRLTVVNKSVSVSATDVAEYVVAQQEQLDLDFGPAYGVKATVGTVPGGWVVTLSDGAMPSNALAYHDVDPSGTPYAVVGVAACAAAGVSWQSAASHEVLEMLADPSCTKTVKGPNGCDWDWEVCDPVENDFDPTGGVAEKLSGFVLPSWFVVGSAGPWDLNGRLKGPFTVDSGGYADYSCNGVQGGIQGERVTGTNRL